MQQADLRNHQVCAVSVCLGPRRNARPRPSIAIDDAVAVANIAAAVVAYALLPPYALREFCVADHF